MFDHGRGKASGDGVTLHACQLRPESRGYVTLASDDPFEAPRIDPGYLATQKDKDTLRAGLKLAREIMSQGAFAPYLGRELSPGWDVVSDSDLDACIRRRAETIYHPVGSCRMGGDEGAVVDEQLRVRGAEGVRVVDASVMPAQVSGNTHAPTVMIAEKAADMILGHAPLKAAHSGGGCAAGR